MFLGRLWFFVQILCHLSISLSERYEYVEQVSEVIPKPTTESNTTVPVSCMKPVENSYQPICTISFREEGSFATIDATCLEPNVFLLNPNRSQPTTETGTATHYSTTRRPPVRDYEEFEPHPPEPDDVPKTEDYQYFAAIYNEQLPPYARISCSAAFPINFDFDGVGALDFFRIWKSQKQNPSNITYSVYAEVLLTPEATGRYVFHSIEDPTNRTEIFIFSERGSKPYLIGGNRVIPAVQQSPPFQNKTILPCISSDLEPNITLFQHLGGVAKGNWTAVKSTSPAMSYEYVRQSGFVFNKKLPPGDYKCASSSASPQMDSILDEEDYVIVRVMNATDLQNAGKKLSNLKIVITKSSAVCYSLQNGTSQIHLSNAYTQNPTESYLLTECLKRKHSYCGSHSYHKRREGKRINRRCPANAQSCMWITDVHPQGIFYCSAGDDSENFVSVEYFTGLDGHLYKATNVSSLNPGTLLTPTWYPDRSSTELRTGIGYNINCNAAGLVLMRDPFTISIVHKNGSTIKLADVIWYNGPRRTFLTTDMTEIICTDSLWISHVNVSMGRKINVTAKPCPPNYFTCKNGQCIMGDLRCDGGQDCEDGSDEVDCHSHKCKPGFFKCGNARCIHDYLKCNNFDDCGDGGSDEYATTCADTKCSADHFKCNRGQCVSHQLLCDGHGDCLDKSDEDTEHCMDFYPEFLESRTDVFVNLNTKNEIVCGVKELPTELKPTIEWFKDGAKITDSGQLWQDVKGFKLALRFDNVSDVDNGKYLCAATNKLHKIEQMYTITVVHPISPTTTTTERTATVKIKNTNPLAPTLAQIQKAPLKSDNTLAVTISVSVLIFIVIAVLAVTGLRWKGFCKRPEDRERVLGGIQLQQTSNV